MTTLQMTRLGVVVEIRKTGEHTGGELVEFDVIGRAARPHRAAARPHPAE